MNVLIYVLLGIGALFNGLGAVALIRFPDVYTRIHGATKCTTFGSIFSILGWWCTARCGVGPWASVW